MKRSTTTMGFTLAEALIIILVLAVGAAVAVPGMRTRSASKSASSCAANLRQLESAKEQWLFQNSHQWSSPLRSDLDGSFVKQWPECPSGGEYSLNGIGAAVTCSIGGDHKL